MIVSLKTASPVCEIALYKGYQNVATKNWQADRRLAKELLSELEAFLQENNATFSNLSGLIIFNGPGSFTGLRIGATVFNALAYSLGIPIVGVSGDNWQKQGLARLKSGKNDKIVQLKYGHATNTTKPKK